LRQVPYVADGSYSKTSGSKPWGVFQAGPVKVATDLTFKRALFINSDTKRVELRSFADVASGTDAKLAKTGVLPDNDSSGHTTLRQGWASYDKQIFYLIGDGKQQSSREVLSYDAAGKLLWRIEVEWCGSVPWQEPEGLQLPGHLVLKGGSTQDPPLLVGYMNRSYSGGDFTRKHVIIMKRDPHTRLRTDAGAYYVDPHEVNNSLTGWTYDFVEKVQRPPLHPLWIEKIITKPASSGPSPASTPSTASTIW